MSYLPPRNVQQELADEKAAFDEALENWTGRWFPEENPGPTVAPNVNSDYDIKHVPMGPSSGCDDGKVIETNDLSYNTLLRYKCLKKKRLNILFTSFNTKITHKSVLKSPCKCNYDNFFKHLFENVS